MAPPPIRLFLADVDGTLANPGQGSHRSGHRRRRETGQAGILFAITSGRPPRGVSMLIEALQLSTPIRSVQRRGVCPSRYVGDPQQQVATRRP